MSTKEPTAAKPSRALLFALLLCGSLSVVAGCRLHKDIKVTVSDTGTDARSPKYYTVAHRALEIESEIDGIEADYELLDSILDEAKTRIKARRRYSKRMAVKALLTMKEILEKRNFVYKREVILLAAALQPVELDEEARKYIESTFTQEIKYLKIWSNEISLGWPRKFHARKHLDDNVYFADCDDLTLIYLAIGEVLRLPLEAAGVPGHCFIRWRLDDGSYLNWETTVGILLGKYYASSKGAKIGSRPDMPIEQALQEAKPIDALAIVYLNQGRVYVRRGDFESAIESFTTAIKTDPNVSESYGNRASAYIMKGRYFEARRVPALALTQYNRAIEDCTKELEVNPYNSAALTYRGIAYNQKGNYFREKGRWHLAVDNYDRAIEDYTQTIETGKRLDVAYRNRAILYYRKGDYDKSWEDVKQCRELGEELPSAFLDRLREAAERQE